MEVYYILEQCVLGRGIPATPLDKKYIEGRDGRSEYITY